LKIRGRLNPRTRAPVPPARQAQRRSCHRRPRSRALHDALAARHSVAPARSAWTATLRVCTTAYALVRRTMRSPVSADASGSPGSYPAHCGSTNQAPREAGV